MVYLHKLQVDYIYTEPTSNYDLMGDMGEADEQRAIERTKVDNVFLFSIIFCTFLRHK